jgi:hypothetical protein
MVTNPLDCYATAIVQCAVIYWLFIDASCFWRYIVTSRKQLFKRLHSVNDWNKVFEFIFLVRPFSIIQDSFQNKIQRKLFMFNRFFKRKGERSPFKQIWVFTSFSFLFSFYKYEIYLTDIAPYCTGKGLYYLQITDLVYKCINVNSLYFIDPSFCIPGYIFQTDQKRRSNEYLSNFPVSVK